jgi:hypothetical protein
MLTARDEPDGDTFRIEIWDRDTGSTIYDSQLGDGDNGTVIEGGSITVHIARSSK